MRNIHHVDMPKKLYYYAIEMNFATFIITFMSLWL